MFVTIYCLLGSQNHFISTKYLTIEAERTEMPFNADKWSQPQGFNIYKVKWQKQNEQK